MCNANCDFEILGSLQCFVEGFTSQIIPPTSTTGSMLLGHMQIQIQAIGLLALKIAQSTVAVSTRKRPPGCACCLATQPMQPTYLLAGLVQPVPTTYTPNSQTTQANKRSPTTYSSFCQNVTARYQGAAAQPCTTRHHLKNNHQTSDLNLKVPCLVCS
jgi:hypothetical protein